MTNNKYVVIGFSMIALSLFLLLCPLNQNPLYNFTKPTVEHKHYTLLNQRVCDVVVDGELCIGCLVMDVQPLDSGLNRVGDEEQLHFKDEHEIRYNLKNNETIMVTWLHRIDGISKINGVVSKDLNDIIIRNF